jgi:hypothetical protein
MTVATLVMLAPTSGLRAAELEPPTIAAWDAYVRATEERMGRELASVQGFLAGDFSAERVASLPLLERGRIPVVKVATTGDNGEDIEVPGGLVHHWRGTVFVPGATIDEILDRVANPRAADTAQEDVLESRVLARGPRSLRLFLRLQRSQIVTVVYNTEHDVRYERQGPGRATSRSVATRIAEVAEPQTPAERERVPGRDRGFLWRLNSYWRYQQVDRGVVVECESISLSRTVPGLLRVTVQPIIDHVARGSMERTLSAMRDRFAPVAARAAHGS